jgi:hypothetical protein
MAKKSDRSDVLGQVRNPLIFVALALLLIEGIIGFVVASSNMTEPHTFYSVCIMAGLFVVVVGLVTWITIKWPRHLYEDIVQGLETTRAIREYLESPAFRDTIEDVVYSRVRGECLKEEKSVKEEQSQ